MDKMMGKSMEKSMDESYEDKGMGVDCESRSQSMAWSHPGVGEESMLNHDGNTHRSRSESHAMGMEQGQQSLLSYEPNTHKSRSASY